MVKAERETIDDERSVLDEVLNEEGLVDEDFAGQLAVVESAKAIRREAQKVRKGKRLTFDRPRPWRPVG